MTELSARPTSRDNYDDLDAPVTVDYQIDSRPVRDTVPGAAAREFIDAAQ